MRGLVTAALVWTYLGLVWVAQLTLGAALPDWWASGVGGMGLGVAQALVFIAAWHRARSRERRLARAVRQMEYENGRDVIMGCDAPWLPLPGFEDVAELEVTLAWDRWTGRSSWRRTWS